MAEEPRGRAAIANAPRQPAGIDAGNPDKPLTLEPAVEVRQGPKIRWIRDRRLQHDPARGGVQSFDVVVIGSHVADMGEGERDDLAGVGGIGDDLLVARHGRVEANLSDRRAGAPDAVTPENGTVVQHQNCRRPRDTGWGVSRVGLGHQCGSIAIVVLLCCG